MLKTFQKIKMVEICHILPNPYQIRRNFNQKSLQKLSESIKSVGIISPVILRACKDGYETVCGQRRIMAARMAGLSTVPAILLHKNDEECAIMSMSENIHRENPDFFEEADGFFNLISYHGMKKDRIKEKLCVESDEIRRKLRIASALPKTRAVLERNKTDEEKAVLIFKIRDEWLQSKTAERVAMEELSLKETEILVNQALETLAEKKKTTERKVNKREVSFDICKNTITNAVEMIEKSGNKAEINQKDRGEYVEFCIKVFK